MMKKISLLFFILMTFSCNGNENKSKDNSNKNQDKVVKRYDVKSGIINYKTVITGSVMGSTITGSGTSDVYFKNYGALELREEKSSQTTVTVVLGNKTTNTTNSHTMNKLDNGTSYIVDYKQKKIYKQDDLAIELIKEFQPNSDAGKAGKNMFEAIGGKKIGNENYKGYDCEIWENMGIKQWIYKGITLKSVGVLMGITTTMEAENIELNVNVTESYFKLPDFPIVEQESFLGGGVDFDGDYDEDMEDIEDSINRVKGLSFEEWKKLATADDEEMRAMSDKELRSIYDTMQRMIKSRE